MEKFFTGIKEGFELYGEVIILVINSILLSFVYIFGIGVTSIIAKLSGKRFLDLRTDKELKSYWKASDTSNKELNDYYKQF